MEELYTLHITLHKAREAGNLLCLWYNTPWYLASCACYVLPRCRKIFSPPFNNISNVFGVTSYTTRKTWKITLFFKFSLPLLLKTCNNYCEMLLKTKIGTNKQNTIMINNKALFLFGICFFLFLSKWITIVFSVLPWL